MARERRGASRRGPKLPIARMERAVELKLLGFKWGEIVQKTKTPYGTLMRWYAMPEWKELEADWLAQDPLVRRARAVIARGLEYELMKKGRPDTALAERILTPARNGDSDYTPPASATAQSAVFVVPMPDRGLESKPVHEVLARVPTPAAAPLAEKKPAPRPDKASRRRIVSEDEE